MVELITKQIMFLGYCSLERDFSQEFGFLKFIFQVGIRHTENFLKTTWISASLEKFWKNS